MLHFFWLGYEMHERSYSTYESANGEIEKWAEYNLSQKGPFHRLHSATGHIDASPDDVLLGIPTWDTEPGATDWVRDNAIDSGALCHPNSYILVPWVPEFPFEWTRAMPHYESQLLAVPKIFALCGDIWIRKTFEKKDDSVQARVRDKLVHLNMGIAAANVGIPKRRFNPHGQRQLLHISTLGSYKGFDVTCKSLVGVRTLLNVGSKKSFPVGPVERTLDGGETMVFNFLGPIDNADPAFNEWVADHCDFYIHTATMDAQATVILESCARGLIPLVTPESGFSSPHAIYLTHDPIENRQIIEKALAMPEDELFARSRLLRKQVFEEHDWKTIYQTIWETIEDDRARRAHARSKS
jgi:hypothetical protein